MDAGVASGAAGEEKTAGRGGGSAFSEEGKRLGVWKWTKKTGKRGGAYGLN